MYLTDNGNDAPRAVGISGPNETAPTPLDEVIESERFKSYDWQTGERIGGGLVAEYTEWDCVEVLSRDPSLRIRRVSRANGAKKWGIPLRTPQT